MLQTNFETKIHFILAHKSSKWLMQSNKSSLPSLIISLGHGQFYKAELGLGLGMGSVWLCCRYRLTHSQVIFIYVVMGVRLNNRGDVT